MAKVFVRSDASDLGEKFRVHFKRTCCIECEAFRRTLSCIPCSEWRVSIVTAPRYGWVEGLWMAGFLGLSGLSYGLVVLQATLPIR